MAAPRTRKPIAPRPVARSTGFGASSTPGAKYSVQKATGGVWHNYSDGRRVFVKASQAANQPAQAAAASQSAASAAAASAAAAPPDPRDSQYFADSAADLKQRTDRINGLVAEDAGDETNYREALRRFREQQPRQLRANLVNSNRQGLAESTVRSEEDADIITNNQRQETDMVGARAERAAARRAAREALEQGASIEEAARLAEAADRKINYYEDRANENSLVTNPADPAQQQAPPKPANRLAPARAPQKNFKTVVKGGRVLRYYGTGKNTRKVDVRAATKRPRRRAR